MSTASLLPEIARIIREAPNPDDGKNELYAIAQRHIPAGYRVWKVLKEIDWSASLLAFRDAMEDRLRTCILTDATGIYLGIDGLNMPCGKGIELGCSRAFEPGSDGIDFIFDCDLYCDELPMLGLSHFYEWYYSHEGHVTFGSLDSLYVEYPVCLGVSALVIREAFRGINPEALRGAATERCFAYGFHDGDMLRLGRATAAGFNCDTAFA